MTWDDDTSEEEEKKSESEKPDISTEKFMAFMVTSVSASPPKVFDDGTDRDNSESEAEHD